MRPMLTSVEVKSVASTSCGSSERWSVVDDVKRPKSAIDALASCNTDMYPSIAVLLKILVTIPVTTATASERTFSALKRLKTYLRTTMSDDRMSSLALMHIHAETVNVDPYAVVDKYAMKGPHRLNFCK